MTILAGVLVAAGVLVGLVLTLLTLPGIWFSVLVALACQWWRPELFNLWTLAAAVAIGIAAEAIEFAASGFTARRAGGSRSAAAASIAGSLIGALVGTVVIPIPILGTIIGAIAGAGIGALAAERGIKAKSWKDASAVATSAAKGRAYATVIKAAMHALLGLVLVVGAFNP